jgi:hypothetical protein
LADNPNRIQLDASNREVVVITDGIANSALLGDESQQRRQITLNNDSLLDANTNGALFLDGRMNDGQKLPEEVYGKFNFKVTRSPSKKPAAGKPGGQSGGGKGGNVINRGELAKKSLQQIRRANEKIEKEKDSKQRPGRATANSRQADPKLLDRGRRRLENQIFESVPQSSVTIIPFADGGGSSSGRSRVGRGGRVSKFIGSQSAEKYNSTSSRRLGIAP